jgi:hypothetical protein
MCYIKTEWKSLRPRRLARKRENTGMASLYNNPLSG